MCQVGKVALAAMGLMLGGPIALKREGGFGEELIVLFMLLTFLTTANHGDLPLPAVEPAHDCDEPASRSAKAGLNAGRVSRSSAARLS